MALYESIKNAEPSELVKKLADISYFIMESYSDKEPLSDNQKASRKCFLDYCKEIKQSLIQAEQDKKKATCWNIVVEKNVDVSLIKKYDFVEDYNSAVWIAGRHKLVKEEFTTLKEGLE